MAKTNVKKKKKKTASYDVKIITIIASVVGTIVAAVVIAFCITNYFSSYVAKVDGERIYKYEYELYLDKAMSDIRNDAIEEGDLKEDADEKEIAAFWTDEKKKEATDKAMKDVAEWKAEYILAKKAGFKLSFKKRAELKQNINNMLAYQYQQYSSYYSYDDYVKLSLGMSVAEYLEIAAQDQAITDYKTELKKAYSADDKELKEIYDKAPDDYRLVTLRVFGLSKPEEVEKVEKPAEKDTSSMTDTEKKEYEALQEKYKEDKKKYDAYIEEIENMKKRLEDMAKQLNEKGKYTGAAEESNSSSSTGDATDGDYKDATLADIIKKEGGMFTDTAGIIEINAVSSSGYDTIDEYALTMQWADDACTKIHSVTKDDDGKEVISAADGEVVGKTTLTKYVFIEDDKYMYVVRCEGIEDYANSEESSAGAADSVKDNIRAELYEEKAVAELEKKVADAGKKFNVKSKRQESIDKINKNQVWS